MLNSLKIRFYRYFNRWFFKWKGVNYGFGMLTYNKVYLTGSFSRKRRENVFIGNEFHLTSSDGINPICRNLGACIHLGNPKATITIGNHVGMSSPCIWIQNKLTIGNHVKIGGNCLILDTDTHQIDFLARRGEKTTKDNVTTTIQSAPITIEDDVWIGANCIILKGVTIGARSVIGAGSVVTKSIPSDCIAAGNPCRVIRELKP
jgi:acetyltransferase-like isoleucine patch superfamily enzyme